MTAPIIKSLISRPKQQGMILVLSLILLLLLTLISVTSIQTTTLEEKMAGNKRNRNLAFQAAEATLRDAEQFIESDDTAFNPLQLSAGPFQGEACSEGLCPLTAPPIWSVAGFNWLSQGRSYSQTLANLCQPPRYVIELLEKTIDVEGSGTKALFRITVMAWGSDTHAVVQIQSLYILPVKSIVN